MILIELTLEMWQDVMKKQDVKRVLSPAETLNSGCGG